mmetsp:Transcript_18079/g.52170  ORF Transcript_18079/g.52170 Transcript_18079/m.52170 type:complete len:211 (-) Transcript_18079:174-806(-)
MMGRSRTLASRATAWTARLPARRPSMPRAVRTGSSRASGAARRCRAVISQRATCAGRSTPSASSATPTSSPSCATRGRRWMRMLTGRARSSCSAAPRGSMLARRTACLSSARCPPHQSRTPRTRQARWSTTSPSSTLATRATPQMAPWQDRRSSRNSARRPAPSAGPRRTTASTSTTAWDRRAAPTVCARTWASALPPRATPASASRATR